MMNKNVIKVNNNVFFSSFSSHLNKNKLYKLKKKKFYKYKKHFL